MSALRPLQTTGYSSNRIDMVFMGDGYRASEIGTTYSAQIRGFLAYMFGGSSLSEPFGRYKNFFNIHAIDVVSNEAGADDPAKGILRDTALDASYSGRVLNLDLSKADQIEKATLPSGVTSDMRFILVNDATYGGAGFDSSIYSAGHPQAYEIALHEMGHAFAGLADEYNYGVPGTYAGTEPGYVNVTADPGAVKWARWLGYDQPGIGVIGAYEGAYYHGAGLYRPSFNSKMNNLDQPFDAVSREQFIRKFYEFVDPLDGYTDPWGTKSNLTDFYVDTIDPAVILVDWTVDGETAVNAGETFRITKDHYGFGTHIVTARAYDPTDWVRGDRTDLEQTVSWTVVNDFLLTGGSAADRLTGNGKPNEIQGRNGNDTIFGGSGNDTLWGQSGKDVFVFNTKLGTSTSDRKVNFDAIKDFSVKDDSIWLDNAIFKKIGSGSPTKPKPLKKDFFKIGKATDKNDTILYDKKTGVLSYDADGSGKGKAVEFAQLAKNLKLTEKDFFVI